VGQRAARPSGAAAETSSPVSRWLSTKYSTMAAPTAVAPSPWPPDGTAARSLARAVRRGAGIHGCPTAATTSLARAARQGVGFMAAPAAGSLASTLVACGRPWRTHCWAHRRRCPAHPHRKR
jgi:hypothetical protein